MRELLKRGIAVHHSGILPIIKEVVIDLSYSYYIPSSLFILSGYRTLISKGVSQGNYNIIIYEVLCH